MPIRDVQKPLEPFSLMGWIESNKHRLMPPVTNETVFKGNDNFIVMVSGGPNSRKDYHYNESEELFFQLKGDIKIGLYHEGKHKTVDLREGEMFLIPPKVPHSPQRFVNTYGLIIEKHRQPGEKDGFMYFCEKCGNLLYEECFFLEDIVKQFPMVMRNFYSSLERRTCKKCSAVMDLPANWEQSIAARGQENEYEKEPLASVHGKSW